MGKKKESSKGKAPKRKIRKKVVDNFIKKEWYYVKAPAIFERRDVGMTLVNKSAGNFLAADSLKNRVFEISQADLNKDSEEDAYRIFRLRVEDVQGKVCLTNFYGMRISTDKRKSIPKKKHTLIEAFCDIKSVEGYLFRVFAIAITKRAPNQRRETSFAQSSQIRAIRKKMIAVLEAELSGRSFNEIITRLQSRAVGSAIEKACKYVYPVNNALISKIKTLRAPKVDLTKLMEMHGGAAVVAADAKSAANDSARVDREDVEMEDADAETAE